MRTISLPTWQIVGGALLLAAMLVALSGAIYHFIVLKAAREGWPVVSQIVKLVVKDEIAQRDRFMRENLDAMAAKVGEMQAKLMRLEAMGERVSGMAGLKPDDLRGLDKPQTPSGGAGAGAGGKGGAYLPIASPSLEQLHAAIDALDAHSDRGSDIFTLVESRLLEARLQTLMVPSSAPVDGPVGSGFGFRTDPFTGRGALHTGLDFPVDAGTPIAAAAGGVVQTAETHPAYGRMVEIDHGNGLVTRYAHASRLLVQPGDLIKRGQVIAEVGNTGRSTGPHLHFEVLVEGVPQNPAKFLAAAKQREPATAVAAAKPRRAREPREPREPREAGQHHEPQEAQEPH